MDTEAEVKVNGLSPGADHDADVLSGSRSACARAAVPAGCARTLRSCIPVNYKEEIVQLLKLAGPVVSSSDY